MSPVVYIFVFVAALLAFEGFRSLIVNRRGGRRAAAGRRMQRLAAILPAPESDDDESLLRPREFAGSRLERLLHALPSYDRLGLQIYRAGLGISPARLVALSATLGAVCGLGGGLLFPIPGAAVPLAALGFLPWLYVMRRARRRMHAFEEHLPDALDLLTRALRAGHSLSTGFQLIASELPDPIGTEFSQLANQIQLGQEMRTALADLEYRVESPSMQFLVTAIVIQRETGSNLTEILESLAAVIRERFRFEGKVRSLTAIGRASANLLAVWPVVIVSALYSANPGYVEPLWTSETGKMLVVICAALIAVGYAWCRRMAVIRV